MLHHARLILWLGLVMTVTVAVIVLIGRSRALDGPQSPGLGRPLRVGYAIEAPYAFRDPGGGLHGEAVDMMRAALRRIGRPEPVWIHAEFAALMHELEMGRIDAIASGLFITPERATRLAFSRPTAVVQPGLLVATGNPLALHSLADVIGDARVRLCVLEQSVEQGMVRRAGLPDSRLRARASAAGCLADLQQGEVQAVMLSAPSLRWMVRQLEQEVGIRAHGQPVPELAEPFWTSSGSDSAALGYPALAFRRGDRLRDEIDAALATYIGSPEHLQRVSVYGFDEGQIAPVRGEPLAGLRGTDRR
ncbi:MAG: hypothetical protein RL654_2035 [Pseudomonadota bacterium]|jgi:polar amino acid transport system substrate-binding protein